MDDIVTNVNSAKLRFTTSYLEKMLPKLSFSLDDLECEFADTIKRCRSRLVALTDAVQMAILEADSSITDGNLAAATLALDSLNKKMEDLRTKLPYRIEVGGGLIVVDYPRTYP